jgi:Anti-sigma factor NepR
MTGETEKTASGQRSAGPENATDDDDKAGKKMDQQNHSPTSGPAADPGNAGLPVELQGYLGRHLRTVYRELVETPVPDKFLKLLETLEKSERPPEDGK